MAEVLCVSKLELALNCESLMRPDSMPNGLLQVSEILLDVKHFLYYNLLTYYYYINRLFYHNDWVEFLLLCIFIVIFQHIIIK